MDIFKLIFHHDLLVDQLEGSEQNRTTAKAELSLEDFMKPMPTYSRFYLSATNLENEFFGLSATPTKKDISTALSSVFKDYNFFIDSKSATDFDTVLESIPLNTGFIASKNTQLNYDSKLIGKEYVREYGSEIRSIIEQGDIAILKVQASHGYDIQIFTMNNIYSDLFYNLKPLISNTFRLFSINGKRLSSDRLYYFETYRLSDPPHGFEEVLPSTVY